MNVIRGAIKPLTEENKILECVNCGGIVEFEPSDFATPYEGRGIVSCPICDYLSVKSDMVNKSSWDKKRVKDTNTIKTSNFRRIIEKQNREQAVFTIAYIISFCCGVVVSYSLLGGG